YCPNLPLEGRTTTVVNRRHAVGTDELGLDVQRNLRRLGYYRGAIDGNVGPGTRAAIRNYQSEHGLRVTGRIDSELLEALEIG
ncbi:MAG: peptidoglycan-binding domain-containing protein, partial [Verrucomicrobiota bacterium]